MFKNLENILIKKVVTATGWDMRKCSGFKATATMKDVPLKIGGEYCWEDNSKGYDPPQGLAAQLRQFHRREGRHGGGKERSSGQVIAVPELRGKDGRQ